MKWCEVKFRPLAHVMFSGPGTITFFTVQITASCWVGSSVTSLSYISSPSCGWSGNLPSACGIPLGLLLPSGNGVDIGYTDTVSPTVDWAESSCPPPECDSMIALPAVSLLPCCKCHTFTAVLFSRESDFHMTFPVGHWLADLCYLMVMLMLMLLFPQRREASTVIKQLSSVSVSIGICPSAMSPTLGTRTGLLQVYHPIWEGGLCTRPTAVDKQLNRLAWYEIDDAFIFSSHIRQKGKEQKCTRHRRSERKEGRKDSTIEYKIHISK